MSSRIQRTVIFCVALAAGASLHAAEPSGKKALVDGWTNRTVVLKRPLFSVVYDERSRVLPAIKHRDRVTGLTMVTPTGTAYYQFDAKRDWEEDIIVNDPNEIVSEMKKMYFRSMHIDSGTVQDVQPLMLVQYSPGVELIVRKVQIERDRVRLNFHKEGKGDVATTLTVKWPLPLSKELTESPLIDDALSQFLARQ
jgi:hypothetical protein